MVDLVVAGGGREGGAKDGSICTAELEDASTAELDDGAADIVAKALEENAKKGKVQAQKKPEHEISHEPPKGATGKNKFSTPEAD